MTAKKGKEGVKDDKVLRDSAPDSNHADEPHKGNDFAKNNIEQIKRGTASLENKEKLDAFYEEALRTAKAGGFSSEEINAVHKRLSNEGYDPEKIKILDVAHRAAKGIKNEGKEDPQTPQT